MLWKKTQVVMLPTNEKAPIVKQLDAEQHLVLTPRYNWSLTKNWKYQHLYFLSDEEPKEGDWCINGNGNGLVVQYFKSKCTNAEKATYKKIIATTDSSLGKYIDGNNSLIGEFIGVRLPQPSQSFLEVFVTEYNKGNQIKEVLVEYEMSHRTNSDGEKVGFPVHEPLVLKVNSKNNIITIKKVKDNWNSKERAEFAIAFADHCLKEAGVKGIQSIGEMVEFEKK